MDNHFELVPALAIQGGFETAYLHLRGWLVVQVYVVKCFISWSLMVMTMTEGRNARRLAASSHLSPRSSTTLRRKRLDSYGMALPQPAELSYEEKLAGFDETPLFMKTLPEDIFENPAVSALQSLVHDGTPDGESENFVTRGLS